MMEDGAAHGPSALFEAVTGSAEGGFGEATRGDAEDDEDGKGQPSEERCFVEEVGELTCQVRLGHSGCGGRRRLWWVRLGSGCRGRRGFSVLSQQIQEQRA
jgi:hypothetical protein